MSKEQFSQGEVNKIFDHVPSRTLRWWAVMELYEYASEAHDGRGKHRIYIKENLYQIGVVEVLTSLNFQATQIKSIMDRNLSANITEKMEGVLLIPISPRNADPEIETRFASSWHPSLGNLLGAEAAKGFDWDTIQALKECDTAVMLNLKRIKEKVDKLVKERS